MFVALGLCGQLTTIADTARGLACDCTCVSCGEPVIARKGRIRKHHFSHHSSKQSCFIQRESLLHLYAKEVIRSHLGLQLPPMPGAAPESEDKTSWWDFERVDEEVPQQGFQPDLVAYLRDGSQLFIEIAVTSFVGEDKLMRIKKTRISTVEIDLSELLLSKQAIPSEEVKYWILKEISNKSWIYPAPTPAQSITARRSTVDKPLFVAPQNQRIEHRYTIKGMWLSARILPTGSVAVRSWSFNPQVTELLRSWRGELGGEYNAKYKSWIFFAHSRAEVLTRLQELDQQS